MFEIIGNIEFALSEAKNVVKYARCLETNTFYDFKKANHYYRLYK